MRIPRDISANELLAALKKYDYQATRQAGSHIRLTTQRGGEHHITIPNHKSLRIGTLNSILKDVSEHLKMDRDKLIESLFEG